MAVQYYQLCVAGVPRGRPAVDEVHGLPAN
jgi:hypothetical protein